MRTTRQPIAVAATGDVAGGMGVSTAAPVF